MARRGDVMRWGSRSANVLTGMSWSLFLGVASATAQDNVGEPTRALTEELRRQSQASLEAARVQSLCTQNAIKVNADQSSAAYQKAFADCLAANAPKPAAGAPASARPGGATTAAQMPDVGGTYVGVYACGRETPRLKVEIDQRNAPVLTAVFTFYPATRLPGTSSDSFSFSLEGRYEPSSETRLTPKAWVSTPPPGYSMVGMAGEFDTSGGFNGRIQGPGCSTFSLSKDPAKVAEFVAAVSSRPTQATAVPSQRPMTTGPPANPGQRPGATPNSEAAGASPAASSPQTQTAAASQNAAAAQGPEMDPFARAKANCEYDTVMMHFYDCACYAQKTAQAMQERGVAPPVAYQSKGTTASEVINDPKLKEYQAAVSRYNKAYGEAATAAAATTACISDAGLSK